MNTSSAACAPHSAPETGASTMATPRPASASAVPSVSQGSDDEVSSSSAPGAKPCSRPWSPPTSARTTSPFGTMVTTMSLAAASAAGDAAATAFGSVAARAAATPGAASKSCSGWPARARCEAIGRPMTPRPMKPTRGGDADAFIEGLRDRRRTVASRKLRAALQRGRTAGPLCTILPHPPFTSLENPRHGIASLPRRLRHGPAARPRPRRRVGTDHAHHVELGRADPPAHQGRARGLGRHGREGDQRPGQVPDAAQASLGPARHLRRGARRPGRRLLRHRQLHAGAPSAAAARRAAGRRRHRRDQFGRVLAHPLEVPAGGQRVQGREAARRVHPRPRPDVPGEEAGDQRRRSRRHEDPQRRRHLRGRRPRRSAPRRWSSPRPSRTRSCRRASPTAPSSRRNRSSPSTSTRSSSTRPSSPAASTRRRSASS